MFSPQKNILTKNAKMPILLVMLWSDAEDESLARYKAALRDYPDVPGKNLGDFLE